MSIKNFGKRLYYVPKPTRWSKGIGAELPEEYKKFWREWKLQEPSAVHYIKKEGTYVRNEKTEQVYPVQNIPLPLKYPKEVNQGIWGGEAVVQGFLKKHKMRRRVPHFWFPVLKRSVVYSEVLDTYLSVVVTDRTINLINENHGFDHYLLSTPACDLRSELALKLKRQILMALLDGNFYSNDSDKKNEVYNKYKKYLNGYTREEIDWYGLTYVEACKKWIDKKAEGINTEPLKYKFRTELLAQLREGTIAIPEIDTEKQARKSWVSKLNPF